MTIREISYPDRNTQAKKNAMKKDRVFFADTDDDGTWGVYGDNSGFCYATPPGGKAGAERYADEMNKQKKSYSSRR